MSTGYLDPRHARSKGDDDASLLIAVAAGDETALTQLYHRFARRMLGIIHTVLPDRHEAKDVLQLVVLEIWQRHAARYQPELGPADAWLLRLARSRAIDRVRSRRLRLVSPDIAAAMKDGSGESAAHTSDEQGHIMWLLSTLPEEEQLAVRLAIFAGLSREAIAEHFGIPVGTVKTRLRRALSSLRDKMP